MTTTNTKTNSIIEAIKNLEQKKYTLLNEMFYVSQLGYEAIAVGNTSEARKVAEDTKVLFKEVEKIDKALEVLSELEGYDYKVEVVVTEVE